MINFCETLEYFPVSYTGQDMSQVGLVSNLVIQTETFDCYFDLWGVSIRATRTCVYLMSSNSDVSEMQTSSIQKKSTPLPKTPTFQLSKPLCPVHLIISSLMRICVFHPCKCPSLQMSCVKMPAVVL